MSFFEPYNLYLLVAGLGVLGIATLLHRFADRPVSFPILALGFGWLVFSLPLGLSAPDPLIQGRWTLHLTELGVIVSLMGVGLKIDRFPNLGSWSSVWLLLGLAMPLTILSGAWLGWSMLGLAPATALLLGAVLAPTDPVLASDVQVGEPEDSQQTVHPAEKEDELRFTLTSEAGLNDALAFPFVYLALALPASVWASTAWLESWLIWDVGYRLGVGLITGALLGALLARLLLRLPVRQEHERMRTGLGALAGTLILYAVTEALSGYGFLAVFVGALVIRHYEATHQSHRSLHVFAEQSEQLLMTGILILLGGAIAGGLLAPLTVPAIGFCLLMILLVRPLTAWLALRMSPRLTPLDRAMASFFGIRGIGSLFYLAYALQQSPFSRPDLLWAICGLTVLISVCLHGISASPLMRYRARRITPSS
ncbi:MAG: cation transporter [Salinisphaeraceae bacterium]|nr:cation transporter [Salinisphaeraceae bacterium]